jgi:two-component system sensor histidine kinase DesK
MILIRAGQVLGLLFLIGPISDLASSSDSSTVGAYTVSLVAVGAIMASLGSTTRANRKLREAREELARLAVAEERSRIARDLHDLLGHTLSLIALKTELAAKLVESDPRRARTELDDVQEVTRQALKRGARGGPGLSTARSRRRARGGAGRALSGRDRLSHRPIGGRASRRDRERPAPLPLEAP